jgi:hypothetical protein
VNPPTDRPVDVDALAGARGAAFRLPIERGKIREFAIATRSSDDTYLTAEQPIAPPTFLMTAVYWQTAENYVLRPGMLTARRGLHAGQAFTFHGAPLRAGEQLTAQQRIDRIEHKTGRRGGELTFFDVVTEFRDSTATLRAETRSTLVQTSRAVGGPA